jgi:hypothetical protein
MAFYDPGNASHEAALPCFPTKSGPINGVDWGSLQGSLALNQTLACTVTSTPPGSARKQAAIKGAWYFDEYGIS